MSPEEVTGACEFHNYLITDPGFYPLIDHLALREGRGGYCGRLTGSIYYTKGSSSDVR